MDLKTTKQIVRKILNEQPETRDSDNALIVAVLSHIEPGVEQKPFNQVIARCGESDKFPTFETIRRTRQKVQAENPHLGASDEVEYKRTVQEHKFFEFAIR